MVDVTPGPAIVDQVRRPTPATLLFALAKRESFIAPPMFLVKPRWRGEINTRAVTTTPERSQAMTWTEKSGAHKFLKRHRAKLERFTVTRL